MDFRYGSHTVFQIEFHFVWKTKYRYKVLTGEIAERIRELVREKCEAFEIRIVKELVSQGPLAHPDELPAKPGAERDNEADQKADQEADIKQTVGRVSAPKEEVLGTALLCHGRANDRRDDQPIFSTSL